MTELLKWYNLVFYIPLMVGIILGFGAGFSGFEHEVGIHTDIHVDSDHDAGAGHDQDHDADQQNWFLGMLGIGRVPIMISFMCLFLLFGAIGSCANILFSPLIEFWSGFALISVAVALVGMFFGTAFVSRVVSRIMPSTETDSMTRADLVGCSGTVTIECDERGGTAQFTRKGDLYQVSCKSEKVLKKGTKVLAIDYDSTKDTLTVVPDPSFGDQSL